MQAEVEQLSAGLCFSITDGGSYYMWQFNASDAQHPTLRPHRWLGGNASLLAEVSLPTQVAIQPGTPFRIRLEVEDESYVRTFINDVLVDERGGSFDYGKIGFRQAHDDAFGRTEIAWYDNIRITVKGIAGAEAPRKGGQVNRLDEVGFALCVLTDDDVYSWLTGITDAETGIDKGTFLTGPACCSDGIYTLSGQRIQSKSEIRDAMPNAGIYICGGKKFIK